jgi:hypothetical protein
MGALLTRRRVILIKLETNEGFDPGLDASSDAILIENPQFTHNAIMLDRAPVKATLGKSQSIYGGGLSQLSFEQEIKGSGSEGVAPESGVPLIACGMSEIINAGVSVVYQTASNNHQSVTIYDFHDGTFRKITGARGDVTTLLEGKGKFSFTLTGHSVEQGTAQAGAASSITLDAQSSPSDDSYNGQKVRIVSGTGAGQENNITDYVGATKVATVGTPWTTQPDATSVYAIDNDSIDRALPTPTYDASVPPPVRGMPISLGAYGPVVSKMEFGLGNNVTAAPSVRSYDGHSDLLINDRDVSGSIDPEVTLASVKDWIDEFKKGTEAALDTGLIGQVAGNRYRVQHPGIYYKELNKTDLEGKQVFELAYGANEVSGDDYAIFTFS